MEKAETDQKYEEMDLKFEETDRKYEETDQLVFEKSENKSKIWGYGPKILGIFSKKLGNPSKIFRWNKVEMDLKFW